MPRSSRHKSHKQSKHSSKDYSDSEEDAVKIKERSNKDEGSTRAHRDSASGEKRKISSQVREGREIKDLIGQVNGEISEEYVSSKRRKEKADVVVGGDRWNGGGDEKEISDRTVNKEVFERASLKGDDKFKENSSKGENPKPESKNKTKRYESGVGVDRNEEGFASVVAEKEEGKKKSSTRKEGKESKDKDRRSNKERNGGHETKIEVAEVKMVDWDTGKKQGIPLSNLSEERQYKRSRDNTEHILQNGIQSPELEKDHEKRIRKKREGSSEREKYLDVSKEADVRRASAKGDRLKDAKQRDEKYKDGGYSNKYVEDGHKDERHKAEKFRQETDKDNKYYDDKYQEDGEKATRRRDYKYREDGDRDSRRKEEKNREDVERDAKRRDEKYREGTEREGRRDDKHREDGDRNNRHRDDHYYEDGDKDIRRWDDRYPEDGDRDDRRRGDSYRDDCDRENRHKDEKYREDPEKIWHKDSKLGDEVDREKRLREIKYEHASRGQTDRSGNRSDPKHSIDDGYSVDYHSRKSSAYDESPTHDDRTARYRDDQNRRRTNEEEDYGDTKPRGVKDQRSDIDKKNSKMDFATDRVRNASRTADADHSSYSRRRSSPPSSSHGIRDHYRGMKQDESKYRDYNYEDRPRHNSTSTREYPGGLGGSEKTASRSFEKPSQKDDGQLHELSAERRLKSDIRSSPLQMSGGSRDWKEYSSKEGRGSRELGMDVAPGDEHLQADADTSSVSSPFAKNSHFSGSSKSLPPPPHFRTGMDSPLPMGSAEDDGRSKSHTRHRRISDPNMGRIRGSPWRGVPSWPSPMPNGFLPFPHGPPPVSFHSVMQPFPAPPMFGVRPSLELNHPSPYHMPDPERFSGPGRPMGWHNQLDDTCPPLHAWNGSNTVFGDESRIYGRPDWDQSRNGPSGRGWETSDDMWKGQNRNKTMEIPSFEKENNSPRSCDEVGQSLQPTQNEQTRVDQVAEIADISLSTNIFEKNDVGAPFNSLDVARKERKEDISICQVYLSKLDISADLAEPELFTKCANLIDMDSITVPDVNDSKILYVKDVEAKMASHRLLSTTLFPSIDGSVFQRSMALYKKQKQSLHPENCAKPRVLFELDPKSDQANQDGADDKPEELCAIDDMQEIEYTLPNIQFEVDTKQLQKADEHLQPVQQTADQCVADRRANVGEPDSALAHAKIEEDVEKQPLPVENTEGSDASSASRVKDEPVEHTGINEELDLVDTKCGMLLNSDVLSEAMMPESVVPESVNLSRIHHSPESTH